MDVLQTIIPSIPDETVILWDNILKTIWADERLGGGLEVKSVDAQQPITRNHSANWDITEFSL